MRKRVSVLFGGDLDHYLLLYACSGKCLLCVQFWVGRGADLNRGTEHHSDWTPLEWALWSDAGSEIIALVTPPVSPSREPAGFCKLALADMYVHVERFQQKRRYGRLSPERRRRRLFVAAVMNSCQRCVRAWLDRGADELCGSA